MSAAHPCSPQVFVACDAGTGYLADRDALVDILHRQTEFDWYVAEHVHMVPAIWIATGGDQFRSLRVTRRQVGGSRSCIEEEWTLLDPATEHVDRIITYAPAFEVAAALALYPATPTGRQQPR